MKYLLSPHYVQKEKADSPCPQGAPSLMGDMTHREGFSSKSGGSQLQVMEYNHKTDCNITIPRVFGFRVLGYPHRCLRGDSGPSSSSLTCPAHAASCLYFWVPDCFNQAGLPALVDGSQLAVGGDGWAFLHWR